MLCTGSLGVDCEGIAGWALTDENLCLSLLSSIINMKVCDRNEDITFSLYIFKWCTFITV